PDVENLRSQEAGPADLPGRGPVIDALQTVEPQSLALTRAEVAQARGYTGARVRVAIIDSGLDISQPDLRSVAATDARGVPLRVDFTVNPDPDDLYHDNYAARSERCAPGAYCRGRVRCGPGALPGRGCRCSISS